MLHNEPHGSAPVIDSVDWLEPLIQRVCDDNKWVSIEEPGYGKGYAAALGPLAGVPRWSERAPQRAA
jgi:hypothetical protein